MGYEVVVLVVFAAFFVGLLSGALSSNTQKEEEMKYVSVTSRDDGVVLDYNSARESANIYFEGERQWHVYKVKGTPPSIGMFYRDANTSIKMKPSEARQLALALSLLNRDMPDKKEKAPWGA